MANTTALDPSVVVEELRAEIRALSERLARLEGREPEPQPAAAATAPPTPPVAAEAPAPEPEPETIPEEILLVISAAVAAFLGERAHVKQVRLIRSPAWAQQGRVTIQASHQLQH
jgi:methylmalonyl-CoA carboxyltransferase large subunit